MSKGHYTFTVEGGSWDTPNTPSGYDYAPYSPVIFPTNGMNSDILYLGNKGGAAQSDNNHYNALMLLPQSFPTPAQGARMEVNYTLVDANSVPYKSGTAWAYFSDFTTKRWEPGKRYLYLIDFSGLIEDGPITFEILAMGWGDNTPQAEPIIVSEAKEPDVTKLLIEKAISQHNSNKANNPALTVFPISLRMGSLVPGPDDQIVTLKDFADGSFVRGDQIRVFCNDNALPRRFRLDPALQGSTWDLQYSTGTNYFIITKL
jgi:hypothetical protein